MNINLLLLIAFILWFTLNLNAQVITHEFGARTSGWPFGNFNLMYKRAVGNAESYTRIRGGFTELAFYDNFGFKTSDFGLGIAAGKEKRRPLSEKFEFIHGFEPSIAFTRTTGIQFYNESGNFTPPFWGGDVLQYYFWHNNTFTASSDLLRQQYRLGLGYILGLQYRVMDNCYLGAELIPGVLLTYTTESGLAQPLDGYAYFSLRGFVSMNGLAVFFSYRFGSYKRDR